jgi:hypothetical protein
VTPGDYFVIATAGGYISAAAALQTALATGADPRSALSALPQVHVSANVASTVNLSLQRGGVITGKLQWDDGTPASGVQVSATPEATTANPSMPGPTMTGLEGGGRTISDDRGEFRLAGLPPGSYIVAAAMTVPVPGSPAGVGRTFNVMMYSPGKARRSDAKAVAVTATEERDEASFTLDLKSFHSVSGQASSTSGPSVSSGSVRLVDTVDSSLMRPAMIGSDGSFSVSYVPEGTYTLEVSAGSATATSRSRTSFQPAKTTVTVTDSDVTGVNVDVSPVAP